MDELYKPIFKMNRRDQELISRIKTELGINDDIEILNLLEKFRISNLLPIEFIAYQLYLDYDDKNIFPYIKYELYIKIISYITGINDNKILSEILDNMTISLFYISKIEYYDYYIKKYKENKKYD